jgi:hypothetical protein
LGDIPLIGDCMSETLQDGGLEFRESVLSARVRPETSTQRKQDIGAQQSLVKAQ